MSGLKDDLVAISGTYFERAKEQVSFFYPKLDLGMMDDFKVICDVSWWIMRRLPHQSKKGPLGDKLPKWSL